MNCYGGEGLSSNEYMNDYMKRRYRERRALAFELLGGHCVNCGTDQSLEIDHVEREGVPQNQKFGKLWNMALERFVKELEKCQLLCYDCHILKSKDDLGVAHGGGVSGKRRCPCELCKAQKRQYMQNYTRLRS